MFTQFLTLFGAGCLMTLLLFLLWPFVTYFVLRYFLSKTEDLKKAGEWVVITGATDGIGKAFAEQLAIKGFNIMLISRTLEKLQDVAIALQTTYNVKTEIFVADFSKDNVPYDKMESVVNSLSSIACLINNVGVSYTYPDDICTSEFMTVSYIQDIISCNVTTVTKMLRIVLPKMKSEPLPPPGIHRYVINIGSFSGFYTVPYLTVYSACKAYTRCLTEGLAIELRDTCIKAQLFAPSFVATNMSGFTRTSLAIPSPTTYVKSALSMLGVESVGCGYFYHAMQYQAMRLLPACMIHTMLAKKMVAVRQKYLRRQKTKRQ